MKKLILKCGFSPGDIVMLTAAVRDLHLCYPGKFTTDVRTTCHDLWENNPHLTPLSENDSEVEVLDCSYPLINRCNETPYHCLHGFIEFLNERLRLAIRPTAFKGDIHLSEQEKAWFSQVHEVTGEDTPFWIIAAGGKYDVTIKWWQTERYQEVVNHFRGKILFVQVGERGHHHPKLEGVVDLRGKTRLRELVRLVYHSQGVLCSVTALMHLAAAVETRRGRPSVRSCVVIAGGREPAHWEAYPGHQLIHTNEALACCRNGGCWKDRTFPLRDGDERDDHGHRCVDVVDNLPRCMDMISATEVIRRIETYYEGGALRFLSGRRWAAAERGIAATSKNVYDNQPLNLHSAGMACDRFAKNIPDPPTHYRGRGIVICGGGVRYFTNAWVCINMLRRLGCRLPVQVWFLGKKEMDRDMEALLASLDVTCVDACSLRKKFPVRTLRGWELKPYAILHSPFREVLFLDADNVPVVNPEFLFDTEQYRNAGGIFWPDYDHGKNEKAAAIWRSCGLRRPAEPELESGQIVVDKQRCWRALRLALWFNEHSDFYYQYLHGDKDTFHLAFRKLKQAYALVPTPIQTLIGTMCQHDFQGRRIFQHRNTDKWDLFLRNRRVAGFQFEDECRSYVRQLQRIWSGGLQLKENRSVTIARRAVGRASRARVTAVIFCEDTWNGARDQTLASLAKTDWGEEPAEVRINTADQKDGSPWTEGMRRAFQHGLGRRSDFILLLEGRLNFNRRIRYNLEQWRPVLTRAVEHASIFNPGVREVACQLRDNARIVEPQSVFGSCAVLVSRRAAESLLRRWSKTVDGQEIRISHLAQVLKQPVFYHAPSLVQMIEQHTSQAEVQYRAMDFDPDWAA